MLAPSGVCLRFAVIEDEFESENENIFQTTIDPKIPTPNTMPASQRRTPLDPMSIPGALQEMVPNSSFRTVTPSDTHPIKGGPARALYVGGTGDVAALTENGVAVTFAGVPAGAVLPIATSRVNATNTTATNIVAL